MNESLNINFIVEIHDFDGYFVDMLGDVYSEKYGDMRKLKPVCDGLGYFFVHLYKNGKQHTKKVHRIVAETFLHNPKNKKQVDHINGERQDNRLENLRWVTHSENQKNACKYKNNTSGALGVSFDKFNNRWIAHWNDFNKKLVHKYFPVKKYGNEAKQLAINYRKQMEEKFYPTKERYD